MPPVKVRGVEASGGRSKHSEVRGKFKKKKCVLFRGGFSVIILHIIYQYFPYVPSVMVNDVFGHWCRSHISDAFGASRRLKPR